MFAAEEQPMADTNDVDDWQIESNKVGENPHRFNRYQKEELAMMGKTTIAAAEYDERFDGDAAIWLIKARCPNSTAVKYDQRFSGKSVFKLFNEDIPPQTANKYPQQYRAVDIIKLHQAGITPEDADSIHSERFHTDSLIQLREKGCPPDTAEKYHHRFSATHIGTMYSAGCLPEDANPYHEKFSGWAVAEFFTCHINPEKALLYNPGNVQFSGEHIVALEKCECKPETAFAYENFHGDEIVKLVEMNCSPEKANTYRKRFYGDETVALVERGYSFERADQYPAERFDNSQVVRLVRSGCGPESVNHYDPRFSAEEVVFLAEAGVSPRPAAPYDSHLPGDVIAVLNKIAITPGEIAAMTEEEKKNLYLTADSIVKVALEPGKPLQFDLQYLDRGKTAVILTKDNRAYKFAGPDQIKHEFNIFEKLEGSKCGFLMKLIGVQKYERQPLGFLRSVFVRDRLMDKLALELEYIHGETLEAVLKRKQSLSIVKTLKYGYGILKGMEELNRKLLCHGDLHPGNIIIRRDTDLPVIIDFGVVRSLAEGRSIFPLNRAFCDSNDLISLGLLLYKMVIGTNLFSTEPGMTHRDDVKDATKARREEVYSCPEKLKECLEQVKKDVRGPLGELIAQLLRDDLYRDPPPVMFYYKYRYYIKGKKETLPQVYKKILEKIEMEGEAFENDIRFLDIGETSMVLKVGERNWKFSLTGDIEADIEFFQKLSHSKYIVKSKGIVPIAELPLGNPRISGLIKDFVLDERMLELEPLEGNTLEHLLEKEKKLSIHRVVQLGFDIFRGLRDMCQLELPHRYLDARTVFVEAGTGRAKIIDPGQMEEFNFTLFQYNPGCGDRNDFISLGLLMYRMVTGNHLFTGKPIYIKQMDWRLRTLIEEVYMDIHRKRDFLDKIKAQIPGILGELITYLLDRQLEDKPGWETYKEARAIFEDCINRMAHAAPPLNR